MAYPEELSNYDLILKDAKTPFPGTPLTWRKFVDSEDLIILMMIIITITPM